MAKLPYMRMFWEDFFADPTVRRMSLEARGVYLLLLGLMWMNKGWLSADDRVIARMLEIDIRSWRMRYKREIVGHFDEKSDPILGSYYTQKRLAFEWRKATERNEQRIANLPTSRKKKPAETTKRRAQTGEEKPRPDRTPDRTPEPAAEQATNPRAITKAREESSALQAESFLQAEPSKVTALQPRPSPGLEGRSVADEPLDAEPDQGLTRRLVADGLKGKRPSLSDIANLGRKP